MIVMSVIMMIDHRNLGGPRRQRWASLARRFTLLNGHVGQAAQPALPARCNAFVRFLGSRASPIGVTRGSFRLARYTNLLNSLARMSVMPYLRCVTGALQVRYKYDTSKNTDEHDAVLWCGKESNGSVT